MTETRPEVTIQPLVSWPRQVVPGGSYLVTVDLRTAEAAEEWPYDQEEFIVGCMLEGRPACKVRAVGTAGVVLHRFGGTYGPARFIADVSDNPDDLVGAALWLTLTTEGGAPFYTGELPLDGAPGHGTVSDLPGVPLKIEPAGALSADPGVPPAAVVAGSFGVPLTGFTGAGAPASSGPVSPVPESSSRTSATGVDEPIRIAFTVMDPDSRLAADTRLIIDMDEGGRPATGPVHGEFVWPLDRDTLEELRWYLEEYLTAPFGVWEERGEVAAASISGWGHAIFEAIFGAGPARDAYHRARARGDLELVFRSSSSAILGLPWELMRDPGSDQPLVLDIGGLGRSLPAADAPERALAVPGGRLRVLMVISRPAGTKDVGYRIIARPLLERLQAVRGEVDLVVLRPPTLDALRSELARALEAGTPYQIVHFDGHGDLVGGARAPVPAGEVGGAGTLVFDGPSGGADYVPASRIAQIMRDASVPVVVLNSAQSGAIGKDLETAIATALLREGVASVVAMAYSVYAVAAAEFVAAFYERLFAGGTVSSAVTHGRLQMYRRPERPSPKGYLPLADWLVPVHYFRREVSFPQVAQDRAREALSLDEALDAVRAAPEAGSQGDLAAAGGVFVGRDGLIYELDVAARRNKVVILVGPGGVGKTELARAFARWWRDTGGTDDPRLVLWHSFEPGVASFGLGGVITGIGLAAFGSDFARLDPQQRLPAVKELLTRYRTLLVWDNFESVRSMPDPGRATPPLNKADCAQLRDFLTWVAADGNSSVVITSRTPEDWLGDFRRLAVGGLARQEAYEYADLLLAAYPAAQGRRQARAFGDLMEWLDGHPLSMRMILPRLETASPQELLESLLGTAPLSGVGEGDRVGSVAASIAYSYNYLSGDSQRRLLALSLIHSPVNALVLGAFSQVPQVPSAFAGASTEDWTETLDAAAGVGLVSSLGDNRYWIHPVLPAYMAAEWRAAEPEDYAATRDVAMLALVVAYADYGDWLFEQIASDPGPAYTIIGQEARNLGSLLGYALDRELWEQALSLSRPLASYWDARGLDSEADAWVDRVQYATVGSGDSFPRLDTPMGNLWVFYAAGAAQRAARRGRWAEAESAWQRITTELSSLEQSGEHQRLLSVGYFNIGSLARNQGRVDEAEAWYRRSLSIEEAIGEGGRLADIYRELGVVARERGRYDEANDWFRRSLQIKEERGDRPGMASSYHQLGTNALDMGRPDEAADWYRRSLDISSEIGDQLAMARTFSQLGFTAFASGRLDEATEWERRALSIFEAFGDRPSLARTYTLLGLTARERGSLGEAENWYRQVATIWEELGNRAGEAEIYGLLCEVSYDQGRLEEAMTWGVRSLALSAELDLPPSREAAERLRSLVQRLGIAALGDTWLQVTGAPLPDVVRDGLTG